MPWRRGNRLRTVAEQNADPAIRRIFEEIRHSLSLPGLQLYYPAVAAYPKFLVLHWEMVCNLAATRELFAAAECLRADAYTRAHNYFHVPDLRRHTEAATGHNSELLRVANYFHYRDPVVLLLFAFQIQAMEGPTGRATATHDWPAPNPTLEKLPRSISEHEATAALRRKYEEIRRTLGTPFVGPELCALAACPEFFDAYWAELKQLLASPLYPACKHGVRDTAWSLAAQLPGPAELPLDRMAEAGLSPEDIASVARILELFVDYLTGSLLNVSAAKIALEGGNLVANNHPGPGQSTQPAA